MSASTRGHRHGASSHRQVIVIAPAEISSRISRSVVDRAQVLAFKSLEEFDHWRERRAREEAIGPDIHAALAELGCDAERLPRRLRTMLGTIVEQTEVPRIEDLARHWPSRRSFYRRWNEEITASPHRFLRRVRSLHAVRLMNEGRTAKEAAHASGFSSVAAMRREIRKGVSRSG